MGARWGGVTAREVLGATGGVLTRGLGATPYAGLSTDSREIGQGDLFWVLKGDRHDAHAFVKDALKKGASGVVLEDPARSDIPERGKADVIRVPDTLRALGDFAGWWRRSYAIPVAAITGSVGKTTTKEMAAAILDKGAPTLKTQGNFNNLIGVPLTLLRMEASHRRAVVEMGMNRLGEIARLTRITDPTVGLITNVARAHLEGLGDLDGVARAKAELVEGISSEGIVLLNGDDRRLLKAAAPFKKRVLTFGRGPGLDFRARRVRNLGREGTAFELHHEGGILPLRVRVPGLQNLSSALAACALALSLGEDAGHLAVGLEEFKGLKGRFMPIPLEGGILLVDDTYNANPVSLAAALQALRDLSGGRGRMIAGLGDMLELGADAEDAHEEAGRAAAAVGIHYLVSIGTHAKDMMRGAVAGGMGEEKCRIVESHEEMAECIEALAGTGDLVLLKASRGTALDRVVDRLRRGREEKAGDDGS